MAKITAEEVRAKYKDIYDYSLDFLFVSDLGGKFIDANDIALSRLGYEREEIPKLNFTDLLDEENLKKAFADTKDIIETGNQSTFGNYKIKAKNGDFIHVETYGIPLKENEKIVAILGIGREITERVIAEEKLRDSEEKYRHLIENSPFSIALVRIDGTIVHANPANEKIFGHTKEDIVGKNFLKLGIFPPETMPLMIQFFDELQKGKRVDLPEFKIFKKDGSSCYVKADISLFNIGNEAYFQVITQDVTEKRESEEKLKQSEEKYRSIMDNISDTVLQMDISGNIEYISPQVQELGDYMPDELLGTNGFNLIHEEDLEDVTRVIKEALEEKRPRRVELRLKHKDGHYVPVSARGTVLRSDTGSSDGKEDVTITCVLRDKTQQKEVEDKLKQSEWKYRHLFDDSPFSIVLLDMKGMIVDCNQKTLQMYKGDKKDFIGKSFQEIGNYPPEDIPKFTKIFMQLLKEGKPVAFENRTFNVLGETFWLKIDATMIKIDGDDYIQVISHDITESKEIANKLLESERKYRLISENVSDIIVVLDESFKFIFINEARERMTGFTIDEILEHPSGYFIHEEDRETSINFLMKVYQEGAATAEVRFKCKDGSFLWMEGKGKRFTDESGEKKLLIIYRDISERKNAEFLLKKSEERYRLITENANDMIIVLDKKFRHEYVNPSYLDALGYSEEEALGKSTLDFVHPDDIASGVEGMKSSFTTGKGAGVFRLKRKDKGYLWTETSGRTFLDSDGKSKVVLFSRDITKRKETEEKYRIVSEHVRDLITIVNDKGTYEYVNYAHLEIMGYKPEDLVGKSMFDIAHPRDIPTATRALVDLVTGKSEDRFQLRVKKKNGEYMWIESGGAVFTDNQGKNKFVFISTDITKRKEMEDRIKESEEKYRLITENANDLIVLLDDQFNVEYMNETITRLQGWNQDEILGISVLKFLHPDDVERATKEYMTGLTMGEGVGEFRLLHMDGYYTWFEIRGKTFQDSEGKTKAVLFARDISKRKETELKLKDSEQLYKSLIENISDTILKLSFTGKILYVSPQVEELGYNPKELIYKNGFSLIHPDDIEKVTNVIYKSYTAKESQTVEFRFKRKNEDYTTVSARGLASEDETLPEDHADKITWTCILRDITARILIDEERKKLYKQIQTLNLELEGKIKERTKELQEAMINAEAANRAKSVFLATMSHELRTPLNSVIAFSEGLLEGFVGDISGKQREYITDIFESGQHLLTLINDILDLSKIEAGRMEFNMEEFSVADLVEKSVSLFKEKSFRHNIAVNVNVSEDIGTLVADERKIKQVLFNLLSNAFKFTADDGNVGIDVEKSGNEIHFSVWDTGIGIAKEDLPKLFQPFSKLDVSIEIKGTTTGLGLYYSRKLVEIHGGTIWVDSRPGIGSRFTFSIPTGEE